MHRLNLLFILVACGGYLSTHSFAFTPQTNWRTTKRYCHSSALCLTDSSVLPVDSDEELALFQKRQALKLSLLFISQDTKRGFAASSSERQEVADIITELSELNPTTEPAAPYYEDKNYSYDGPSLSGKWTLIYTNAPDITSLDPSTSSSFIPAPPPSAKLGRIGQECDPSQSTISNVIEWKRPDWLDSILKTDNASEGRVIQKVVCEAKASPEKPNVVNLQLVGFELLGETGKDDADTQQPDSPFPWLPSVSSLLNEGPAAIFSKNPVSLRGPLKAPFGQFEIKYLDDEMRIIKTGQGYYAVNMRESQPWF